MARHTLTFDLTDQQEAGWASYFAFVNAERSARGEPTFSDVDDFMVNGVVTPAVLGDDYYRQAKERVGTKEGPFFEALREKLLADPETKDRVTQAEALDVKAIAAIEK